MNKYVSRGLWFTLFLGGLSLAGVGVANAAETSGSGGTASGDQAVVSVTAPVTISGNAISVVGDSSSSNAAAPAAAPAPAPAPAGGSGLTTSGTNGVGSGDQAPVAVTAPVTVGGNAVSVVGDSSSSGASPAAPATPAPRLGCRPGTRVPDHVGHRRCRLGHPGPGGCGRSGGCERQRRERAR